MNVVVCVDVGTCTGINVVVIVCHCASVYIVVGIYTGTSIGIVVVIGHCARVHIVICVYAGTRTGTRTGVDIVVIVCHCTSIDVVVVKRLSATVDIIVVICIGNTATHNIVVIVIVGHCTAVGIGINIGIGCATSQVGIVIVGNSTTIDIIGVDCTNTVTGAICVYQRLGIISALVNNCACASGCSTTGARGCSSCLGMYDCCHAGHGYDSENLFHFYYRPLYSTI